MRTTRAAPASPRPTTVTTTTARARTAARGGATIGKEMTTARARTAAPTTTSPPNRHQEGDCPDEEDSRNPVRRSSRGRGARNPDDRGRRRADRPGERDRRTDLARDEAEGRAREVRRPQPRRRSPRLLGPRRREALEDQRLDPRPRGDADCQAQEGRPLLVLVRRQRPRRGRNAGQLHRPLRVRHGVEAALGSLPGAASARPRPLTGGGSRRANRAPPATRQEPRMGIRKRMQIGRKRRILLVEDEESITTPLSEALAREGFETSVAGTAASALATATDTRPDLVLLDVMLPDGSGFDVARELRRSSKVPIIMLTARGEEADRVAGLELGADDYVVKPFSARELVARVRAVFRRVAEAGEERPEGAVEVGEVRLDRDRRSTTFQGDELELSRKEFDLLRLLMENAGSVVTRERLIDEVWDTNWFGSTKTLDVHVSGLRKKLGDDSADPRYIYTVRGVGFRFAGADEL